MSWTWCKKVIGAKSPRSGLPQQQLMRDARRVACPLFWRAFEKLLARRPHGVYRPAFECLEDRVTPSLAHPIYAPDTPQDYVDAHPDAPTPENPGLAPFQLTNRWTSTATNPGPLGQGDPTTLTWRIVSDGLSIPGANGEPTSNSNLIAFMDGIYGGATQPNVQLKPWFPLFAQVFNSWSNLTGLDYVYEPNDDNAAFSTSTPGQLGVRADVRVAGHFIDGNSNVLAYNFYPGFGGDMVLDTGDNFYANNQANNSRGLRNILAHEAGHGIGLAHVMPVNGTKLMEPFINLSFDMQQHDDILAANRHYGDRLEPNDTVAAATNLGTLSAGTTVVNNVSVDDDTDPDLFRFSLTTAMLGNVTLSPVGFTYLSGAQGGPPPVSFNSKAQSDLALQILGADGTTVVASANVSGIGLDENIVNTVLLAGQYYFRISGANDAAQMYSLSVNLIDGGPPGSPDLLAFSDTGVSNTDNLTSLDNSTLLKVLKFVVNGTVPTATVAVYADGKRIGAVVATGTTTTVTTDGQFALTNGIRSITARQTEVGAPESSASPPLNITIDSINPIIQSLNRLNPVGPTTGAISVTFRATFSESVTGVNTGDFQLALTGLNAAINSVTTTPISGVYDIAVSNIAGIGTLGLNLVDDGSIRDLAGNSLTTSNAPAAFQNQQTFATGGAALVRLGDLNGDGKLDLVFAGSGNTPKVQLGNGNGTFQAQPTFAVDGPALSIALGDVNGDGKLDIVTGNYMANNVSVVLGNGNGTFQHQLTFPTGRRPESVALGDVNGDGNLDLAVANRQSNTAGMLLGNGNGTFQVQQTFATGLGPAWVAWGDVNGDDKVDLAVLNSGTDMPNVPGVGGVLSVLLGNGNGTFQTQQTSDTGGSPHSFRGEVAALADVNGDGKPDVAVSNIYGDTVSVLLGNGNGSFQARQSFATGDAPVAVLFGDVNGDGKPDLVVTDHGNPTLGVVLGNGNGTFQGRQTFTTGASTVSVALGELNGDGKPDLVVPHFTQGTAGLFLNAGNSNFTGQTYIIQPPIAPFAQSISPWNPQESTTNATSVTFRLVFSKAVTGVDPTDFDTYRTGSVASTGIQVEQILNTHYNVYVSGITGAGFLGLILRDNNSILDLAGTPLGDPNNGLNGELYSSPYTIAAPAAPFVLSINPQNPVGPTTEATSVTFRVVFSKAVSGVDPSDFQLYKTGTIAATQVQVERLIDTHYNVTISGISGAGKLGLNLIDDNSIRDSTNTPLGDPNNAPDGSFTGQAYTITAPAAPFVESINPQNPVGPTTSAVSVTFRVVFSKAVTGVDLSDFQLYKTGSVAATLDRVERLIDTHYNVTVSGISGAGLLGLNLIDDNTIKDLTGTPLGDSNNGPNGNFTGQSYTIVPPGSSAIMSGTAGAGSREGALADLQITALRTAANMTEHSPNPSLSLLVSFVAPVAGSGVRLLASGTHEVIDGQSVALAIRIMLIDRVMEIDFTKLGPPVVPNAEQSDNYFSLKHYWDNETVFTWPSDLFKMSTLTAQA